MDPRRPGVGDRTAQKRFIARLAVERRRGRCGCSGTLGLRSLGCLLLETLGPTHGTLGPVVGLAVGLVVGLVVGLAVGLVVGHCVKMSEGCNRKNF